MDTFAFNICHELDKIIENGLMTMLKENPKYGNECIVEIYKLMNCICHNKSKNLIYSNNHICNTIIIHIEEYMHSMISSHYNDTDKRSLICSVYKHLSTLYYIKSLDIKCCKCSCIIDICNIDKSKRLGISSGISTNDGINICCKCLSNSDMECLVIHSTGYGNTGYGNTGYDNAGYSNADATMIKLI